MAEPATGRRGWAFFPFAAVRGPCHLLYHSQARQPFDPPALTALLRQARARNRRQHLSGPLLHTPDGQFLQILADEETVVRAL